ncbi:MAG: heme exporter protein CcmB [Ilumatobacteraceae bacterium]
MTLIAVARLMAAKDLRVELRSRVVLNQVLPFAAVVMVLFGFALDNDGILPQVAPGLIWLATMFSLLIVVQRAFAVEAADGALDALQVAGVRPAGIFLGKAAALAVQLFVLQIGLVFGSVLLFNSKLHPGGLVLLLVTLVAATLGMTFVGTIYGGLAAGATGRETLLPLLLLPVVAPVLIGATRATEASLSVGGTSMREGWAWIALLATFATLFGIGGSLAFGSLLEDQ